MQDILKKYSDSALFCTSYNAHTQRYEISKITKYGTTVDSCKSEEVYEYLNKGYKIIGLDVTKPKLIDNKLMHNSRASSHFYTMNLIRISAKYAGYYNKDILYIYNVWDNEPLGEIEILPDSCINDITITLNKSIKLSYAFNQAGGRVKYDFVDNEYINTSDIIEFYSYRDKNETGKYSLKEVKELVAYSSDLLFQLGIKRNPSFSDYQDFAFYKNTLYIVYTDDKNYMILISQNEVLCQNRLGEHIIYRR
jgi:hypothetical protein